jgi:hypothetical protein
MNFTLMRQTAKKILTFSRAVNEIVILNILQVMAHSINLNLGLEFIWLWISKCTYPSSRVSYQ